jgi:S1-C subfamily serine protease
MKILRSNATSLVLLIFGIAGAFSSHLCAQDLSALIQSANFGAMQKSRPPISLAQSESTLNAFLFFDRGSRILSNYREPQATRGAKGISIFREVSPAVTLVVTGDDKNVDGIGTGVVVDSSGYVLTNWHVIAGHDDAVIFLKPSSGAELDKKYAYYARVAYANPLPDLALLKLEKAPSGLPSIAVAEISQAQVAEDIHIIGHPHGQFWSYSSGVLSQIRPDYSWKYDDGSQHRAKVLQMQTAINPGNSGGPVVDDSGKIIGLVAMFEEGQNLDYAIAADVIKSFLAQAMRTQTRGARHDIETAETSAIFAAPVDNGTLYKSEYHGSAVYWLVDKSGATCCMLIRDAKGNTVEARRGTGAVGFSEWKANLENGDELRASSKSEFPEVFWKEATLPSK